MRLMTKKQVATYLNTTERHVDYLRYAGRLPYTEHGAGKTLRFAVMDDARNDDAAAPAHVKEMLIDFCGALAGVLEDRPGWCPLPDEPRWEEIIAAAWPQMGVEILCVDGSEPDAAAFVDPDPAGTAADWAAIYKVKIATLEKFLEDYRGRLAAAEARARRPRKPAKRGKGAAR